MSTYASYGVAKWWQPIIRPFGNIASGGTVAPSPIVRTRAFGVPIVQTNQLVTVTSITRTRAYGTPRLTYVVAPSAIVRTRAFGTPRLTIKITVSAIVRTRAFGSPTVGRGSVTITATAIVRTRAFGSPTLVSAGRISPSSIVRTRAFGTPVVFTAGPPGSILQRRAGMQNEWLVSTFEKSSQRPEETLVP